MYSARGSEVTTVIVKGEIIVDDGKVATVDEERIMAEAQKAAERIASSSEVTFFEAGSKLVQDMKKGFL